MSAAGSTNLLPVAPAAGDVAISIAVNDETRTVANDCTLAALIADLGFGERRGVAVAVNGAVVPRSHWSQQVLRAADRVLVIRATQGG